MLYLGGERKDVLRQYWEILPSFREKSTTKIWKKIQRECDHPRLGERKRESFSGGVFVNTIFQWHLVTQRGAFSRGKRYILLSNEELLRT